LKKSHSVSYSIIGRTVDFGLIIKRYVKQVMGNGVRHTYKITKKKCYLTYVESRKSFLGPIAFLLSVLSEAYMKFIINYFRFIY